MFVYINATAKCAASVKLKGFKEISSRVICCDLAGMPPLDTTKCIYMQALWRAKENFCLWALWKEHAENLLPKVRVENGCPMHEYSRGSGLLGVTERISCRMSAPCEGGEERAELCRPELTVVFCCRAHLYTWEGVGDVREGRMGGVWHLPGSIARPPRGVTGSKKLGGYEDFFQRSQERQTGKTRTTAYLKFPVESEESDLLSFSKSRVSKGTSLEIRGF